MNSKYSDRQVVSRRKARNKYVRDTIAIKSVALNKKTDVDIIEYIKTLDESFSGYVHRLIREDMQKEKAPV